ncbi:MAG: sialate O-acetylesterase [Opitutaceae bacterium]|jgi:sialate O-acetylesterase|nr:sialate O-acetylesterase [Opitutaceae bacterium]
MPPRARTIFLSLVTVTLFTTTSLVADIRLAPIFGDHMVLQRDIEIPVWGDASPGEKTSVTFHRYTASTTAGPDGRWRVNLPKTAATPQPGELVIYGKNRIVLNDIVVGDVWLCSGQSNMEFTVRLVANAARETATADYPLIRHFRVPRTRAATPQSDMAPSTNERIWQPATPKTVAGFSAVGYFYAREIYQKTGIPVGLIRATLGGSTIEAWMSRNALTADPSLSPTLIRWEKTVTDYPAATKRYEQQLAGWSALPEPRAQKPSPPRDPAKNNAMPSGLYNAMIHPLLPFGIRGILWYQGENNAWHAPDYAPLFNALIKQWRADFGLGDIPFYFVQLPNFKDGDAGQRQWAFLREAQQKALALPNTGMAVTIDIGNPDDVHPTNKQDVAHRLALIARARHYGEPSLETSGPVYHVHQRIGSAIRITFKHADGLTSRNGPPTSFELAGADKNFVAATAAIETGGTILVSSPSVPEPVAVRYAWTNTPDVNLYNSSNLPAAPFRTDTWDK